MARRRAPKEVEVSIESLDHDGFGNAWSDRRAVKVRNALPGERVKARILKRSKGTWYAEAPESGAEVAPSRVSAACEFFPRCGGCALQHIDYPAQLELKESRLLSALEANGIKPACIRPAVGGSKYYYRTKARLGVRFVGDQVLVGFRESFSNRVGRMTECLTLVPEYSRLLEPLKKLVAGLSLPHRIPQIELAAGDTEQAVIIRHLDPLQETDIEMLRQFGRQHRVRIYGQSGGYNSVAAMDDTPDSACLSYSNPDFGLHFKFLPWDFTQVNLGMNRRIVRAALLELQAPGGARVVDLFCGIGNFSLALAASGYEVVGYESAHDSIARARFNARLNRLDTGCEFIQADLYDDCCPPLASWDYMVIDPPRSGAGPNLASWIAGSEGGAGDREHDRRVVYVSCNPDSFARDAKVFKLHGYALEKVGIFDMFPHTAHVETMGIFVRHG